MKKEEITTPISNYFSGLEVNDPNFVWEKAFIIQLIWLEEFMYLPQHVLKNSKERHKKLLGKQNYCITLSDKNWVWEGENWRAYVSKRGTSFELRLGLTFKEACEAWQDYYFKLTGTTSKVVCYY